MDLTPELEPLSEYKDYHIPLIEAGLLLLDKYGIPRLSPTLADKDNNFVIFPIFIESLSNAQLLLKDLCTQHYHIDFSNNLISKLYGPNLGQIILNLRMTFNGDLTINNVEIEMAHSVDSITKKDFEDIYVGMPLPISYNLIFVRPYEYVYYVNNDVLSKIQSTPSMFSLYKSFPSYQGAKFISINNTSGELKLYFNTVAFFNNAEHFAHLIEIKKVGLEFVYSYMYNYSYAIEN